MNTHKFLKELEEENWVKTYKTHNRYIEPELWKKLKNKRECDHCKQTVEYRLQIHHKTPVWKGGTNTEENLMSVCMDCHEKLDAEQEKPERTKQNWHNPPYYDHSDPISKETEKQLEKLKKELNETESTLTKETNKKYTHRIRGITQQISGLRNMINKLQKEIEGG